MHRRTLIKQLVFATGAVLIIPSCVQDTGKASILLKQIKINGSQEKLIAELAETMIPATDTPGAKDVSAHLFALMMIDDCYTKEEQKKFLSGLEAFDKRADEQFGKSFTRCSLAERAQLLAALEAQKENKTDIGYFYNTTKSLTIQAYTTSRFYLTKVQVYRLVPGRFHGCVPVQSATKTIN